MAIDKIFISPSNQDGNTYAAGNTNEYVQCRAIGLLVDEGLSRCGFKTALMCEESMALRCSQSNLFGADIHLCIHTNASIKHNCSGVQVFYGASREPALAVYNKLVDLVGRGNASSCRTYQDLYEVKTPKAITVYVEIQFHDVPEQALWIINHKSEIAEAIVQGLCDYAGKPYLAPMQLDGEYIYRVQVGAFKSLENAKAFADKLKNQNYDTIIKKEKLT